METEQLELLRAVACKLGVTPAVSVDGGVTIGRLYLRYKATRPKGRAWRLVRGLLLPFIWRFWRRSATSIGPADWLEHAQKRRGEATRRGKPPCESTINLELTRAKGLLTFAVEMGLLTSNQLQRMKRVRCRTNRETWLTEEQFHDLISNAGVLEDRAELFTALAVAMLDTGMRIGEAIRIRRDRIALNGSYVINAASTKTRKAGIVAFTKRTLFWFDRIPPRGASPYVFASPRRERNGLPYDLSAPRAWFRAVAAASGLDSVVADGDVRLRPHDLRHSAASQADAKGASATAIRDMLRHSSLKSTERYLHRSKEQGAIAMAQLMEPRRPAQKSTHDSQEIVDVRFRA